MSTVRSDQIKTAATPTIRYGCIITGCTWTHDQPGPGYEDINETGSFAEGTYRLAASVSNDEAIIRAHFETHTTEEWAREVASLGERLRAADDPDAHAPAPQPWVPMCTPCLMEAKQAQMRGLTPPQIEPSAVIANGMGLCEIRHAIQVEPPKLLLAQPGQMPNGFGG